MYVGASTAAIPSVTPRAAARAEQAEPKQDRPPTVVVTIGTRGEPQLRIYGVERRGETAAERAERERDEVARYEAKMTEFLGDVLGTDLRGKKLRLNKAAIRMVVAMMDRAGIKRPDDPEFNARYDRPPAADETDVAEFLVLDDEEKPLMRVLVDLEAKNAEPDDSKRKDLTVADLVIEAAELRARVKGRNDIPRPETSIAAVNQNGGAWITVDFFDNADKQADRGREIIGRFTWMA
jgi:hypothetical protein